MNTLLKFIAMMTVGLLGAECLLAQHQPTAGQPMRPIKLAGDRTAMLPIVVSSRADDSTRESARNLARYLQRISGATFKVVEGNGAKGLVVGVPKNFPNLTVETEFPEQTFQRDHYRIVSTSEGLYVLGATPTAVAFAVWDLLNEFGYRYYFPSETWEIVPEQEHLQIAIDRYEQPDFFNRSGPRGGMRQNLQPWLEESWHQWQIRNRTAESFELNTGHSYLGIIKRNQQAFDQHPEYLALRDGKRGGSKFCISNPELRLLIVRDAIARIEAEPGLDSISLDPSDGGGWCDCGPCKRMGSVSDRVVLLANQTAEAINSLGQGDKYVGIYAYNDYSPPPTVKVHSKVLPSMATAFIKGDQTFEELLAGWSQQAGMVGIREYYGLPVWHQAMPGTGRAGQPQSLAQSIRQQYAAGARFMNAESDNAWGAHGLGYYLASRMLWNVDISPEAVIDDFLLHSFGEAREPIREFYEFIGSGPRSSEHMVGTMYRHLKAARQLTDNPKIIQRIDDLVLYTRYVELYRQATDQAGFDRLVTFLWRSRKNNMAGSIGMFWYLNRSARKSQDMTWIPGQPQSHTLPPERLRDRGEEPFSDAEIQTILDEGINKHDILDYTPLEFSNDLVPAREALQLAEVKPLGDSFYGGEEGATTTRGELHNYTWVEEAPQEIRLQVKTGLVYDSRGPATVQLAWRGTLDVEKVDFHVLDSVEVPEDQQWHEVRFTATRKGLYRITWNERLSGTRVKWPTDLPRTVLSSEGASKQVIGRHDWYFYVPQGTKVIGAYDQANAGGLFNPEGEQVVDFRKTPTDYLSIEVPADQAGRLWSVRRLSGRFRLQNVPPYVTGNAYDLLLPREVVERDRF